MNHKRFDRLDREELEWLSLAGHSTDVRRHARLTAELAELNHLTRCAARDAARFNGRLGSDASAFLALAATERDALTWSLNALEESLTRALCDTSDEDVEALLAA